MWEASPWYAEWPLPVRVLPTDFDRPILSLSMRSEFLIHLFTAFHFVPSKGFHYIFLGVQEATMAKKRRQPVFSANFLLEFNRIQLTKLYPCRLLFCSNTLEFIFFVICFAMYFSLLLKNSYITFSTKLILIRRQ